MKLTITFLIALCLGYFMGQHKVAITLQYAYKQVDSCVTDTCVEAWSELLGRAVEAK